MQTARSRAKAAKARAYQEAIGEAAENLFAERGIDATKMEDIAHAAGLSVRTLYSALEGSGKADLVARIRAARLGALVEIAIRAAESDEDALARLRVAFQEATAFFMEHSAYLRMHMREGYAWGLPEAVLAHSPESAVSFRDGVGAIVSIIAEGMERRLFDIERPERVANSIVTLHQVHLADWIEQGEVQTPEVVFAGFWRDVERLLAVSSGAR